MLLESLTDGYKLETKRWKWLGKPLKP